MPITDDLNLPTRVSPYITLRARRVKVNIELPPPALLSDLGSLNDFNPVAKFDAVYSAIAADIES